MRTLAKRFFIGFNIFVIILFLLSCLAPVLNPQKWWLVTFLGLAFPIFMIALLFFFAGWLLVMRPGIAMLSLLALLIGIKSILAVVGFHRPVKFLNQKNPSAIRIVTWNVARFIEMKKNNNKGSQTRLKMMQLIKEQNADIVCLQEFFHSLDSAWYQNVNFISETMNYPYWYFSHDVDADVHYTGSIIFSRFPIVDSGIIRYPRPTLPDALIHADIKINNDTIRVYTTHLQSLQFGKRDYERIGKIESAEDSLLSNSRTILSKIRKGFTYRSIQADLIHEVLGDSPYPILFCADLNDVPTSYTYGRVKGNMQDLFLKKGFGIGRTFSSLSPTLRIDYIFANKRYKVGQFNRIVNNYSDHYMLVADVVLRK